MQCEMCGKDTTLFKSLIEGTELNVCTSCTKFGKVLPKPKNIIFKENHIKPRKVKPEIILSIVKNYSNKIKQKREQLGLKQEDLAKNVNEKWSIIQKIESNHFKPSLDLAKRLEHFLKISLIEEVKDEPIELKNELPNVLTIGDLLKLKAR